MRFILIDEILEADPGRSIKGIKYISPEEDYFQDHFPGFPVVPGVLLLEMMAQTAGKCLMLENSERGKPMLGKITNANFRNWVKPGETVTMTAEIQASQPQFATARGTAEVGSRKVASAEFLFSFVPASQFANYREEALERYLAKQADRMLK